MLSEAKFRELMYRHQESGLDIKAFCSNEGIKESTFYYWRKKLQGKDKAKGFIPLVVTPTGKTLKRQHRYKSSTEPNPDNMQQTDNNDYLLEVVYPNGTRLRIRNDLDLARLRALVYLFD
jgi:transposase-like protein